MKTLTKKIKSGLTIAIISVAAVSMTGCVTATGGYSSNSSLRGDVYTVKEVRKSQNVTLARILSLRPVTIEKETSKVGMGVGGLLGVAAGSQVGGGNGKKIAAAIGGLLGATAGDRVEHKIRKVQGVEIIVQTDKGRTYSVVQEYNGENFSQGSLVTLIGNSNNMRVALLR